MRNSHLHLVFTYQEWCHSGIPFRLWFLQWVYLSWKTLRFLQWVYFIMKGFEISTVSLFYHKRLWDFYSEVIWSWKASILTFDVKLNIYPIFGWVYTAGHGWGISCDFDVNCNVLQSWYNFTFSVRCKTLFRDGKEQYFEYKDFLISIDPFNGNTGYSQMCLMYIFCQKRLVATPRRGNNGLMLLNMKSNIFFPA